DPRGESQRAEEILRQALEAMDPVARLALLVSMDRLPAGDVRDAFRAAAVEPTQALLQALVNNDDQLSLLRERLTEMGVSREQLDELLDTLLWEKLTFDDRIARLLTGTRIFDLPEGKLVRFIGELLAAKRGADVERLLAHYVTGLGHDTLFVRRTVCRTLGRIALFIKDPGVSREIEQRVGTAILNHFVTESDVRMKAALGEAAANFIAMLLATGRAEPALRVIGRLDAAVTGAPEGATVRLAAEALTASFGEAERAVELIAQTVSSDPDMLARFVMPLVTRLGGAATPQFIDALGTEEDRNRRGRLVKALKSIGEPAFPFLIDALRSQNWFVVRNALNVLGDIGRAEHVEAIGKKLEHGDARVRRAAARTLSKIGGLEAEALLVGAMNDRDDETQAEVMLCLASMKAQSAIPALAELARARLLGTGDKVRELAITTLGQIGSDAAVNVLADILRARKLFGRTTPAARAAAARALATVQTPAAKEALRDAGKT
ncbi:MAG: HEAT repeat domain-containing protein, partial [Acidobacteriota bacterium]